MLKIYRIYTYTSHFILFCVSYLLPFTIYLGQGGVDLLQNHSCDRIKFQNLKTKMRMVRVKCNTGVGRTLLFVWGPVIILLARQVKMQEKKHSTGTMQ